MCVCVLIFATHTCPCIDANGKRVLCNQMGTATWFFFCFRYLVTRGQVRPHSDNVDIMRSKEKKRDHCISNIHYANPICDCFVRKPLVSFDPCSQSCITSKSPYGYHYNNNSSYYHIEWTIYWRFPMASIPLMETHRHNNCALSSQLS